MTLTWEAVQDTKISELAYEYPGMDKEEFSALVASIEQDGIKMPILVHSGEIVDGRNRFNALKTLVSKGVDMNAILGISVSPLFEEWKQTGGTSLQDELDNRNVHRRQLSKTALAVICVERLARQERKRGPKASGDTPEPSLEDWAKRLGVSAAYVHSAQRVMRSHPNLFAAMKAGTLQLSEAQRAIKAQEDRAKASSVEPQRSTSRDADGYGEFWKLGDHVVYCGRPTDEAFQSYQFKQSDMNGTAAELCISLVYDAETVNDLISAQRWLMTNSVILAAVLRPADLQPVLAGINAECKATLSSSIDGDSDKGVMGLSHWFPTCLYFDQWERRLLDADNRLFRPNRDKHGDTFYAYGGRPLAYYTWIINLLSDKGDTVIVTALNDGQALFAADGRCNVYGAEPDPSKVRRIIQRWEAKTQKSAVRL